MDQVIIEKIKRKKELIGVSDENIRAVLSNILKKDKISLYNLSNKDLKLIIREVRFKLRLSVGRFRISKKIDFSKKEDILNSHLSTKERMEFYPKIKKLISSLNIKSVLDIGCGINPIALSKKDTYYYACDIDNISLNFVKRYFKNNKIKGEVFSYDLITLKPLPKTDLCLLFKVLDVIENKKKATRFILSLKFKYYLISFSTKKLSGKKMNFPRRLWFERIIKEFNYHSKIIKSNNEIFYLLS